jgi:equilibrative nucleoside transporter 1/2/3
MGNLMSGGGMGGLVPSVVIVIILALDADNQLAGFYSFLFILVLAVVCLALTFVLERTEIYNYYSEWDRVDGQDVVSQFQSRLMKYFLFNDVCFQDRSFDIRRDLPIYLHVLREAWVYHFVVILGFGVTLAVFPSVTVLIEPSSTESSPWNDVYFVPVCCFIAFNFGDYFGKHAATMARWPGPSKRGQATLLVMTFARVALIPLFMFCNVSPLDRNTEVCFCYRCWYVCEIWGG